MTLNEYQTEAMRTAHEDNLLLNGVMGLNGRCPNGFESERSLHRDSKDI